MLCPAQSWHKGAPKKPNGTKGFQPDCHAHRPLQPTRARQPAGLSLCTPLLTQAWPPSPHRALPGLPRLLSMVPSVRCPSTCLAKAS